jgi:RNA polymerase subunit RPABC4/transcription elongation factor Spt4
MANKDKVCKQCGYLSASTEKKCENCGSQQFLDKYKGKAVIFDPKESTVAQKMGVEYAGTYALKYG